MSDKLTPAQREHIIGWIVLWLIGHITLQLFRGTWVSWTHGIIVYVCVLSEYLTYDSDFGSFHLRWIAWRSMRISIWAYLCLLVFGWQGLLVLAIFLGSLYWWDTNP